MAKLHSASPREITSPFTSEIISVLHSIACNYLYMFDADRVISLIYSDSRFSIEQTRESLVRCSRWPNSAYENVQ